ATSERLESADRRVRRHRAGTEAEGAVDRLAAAGGDRTGRDGRGQGAHSADHGRERRGRLRRADDHARRGHRRSSAVGGGAQTGNRPARSALADPAPLQALGAEADGVGATIPAGIDCRRNADIKRSVTVSAVEERVSHLRENPYEIARDQLRKVAKAFSIDDNLVNVLSSCKKAVTVSIPVTM